MSRVLAAWLFVVASLLALGWRRELARTRYLLAVVRGGQYVADRAMRGQIFAEGRLNSILKGNACSY
jgi:hypothetical protein